MRISVSVIPTVGPDAAAAGGAEVAGWPGAAALRPGAVGPGVVALPDGPAAVGAGAPGAPAGLGAASGGGPPAAPGGWVSGVPPCGPAANSAPAGPLRWFRKASSASRFGPQAPATRAAAPASTTSRLIRRGLDPAITPPQL